jgi:hypothetical protein
MHLVSAEDFVFSELLSSFRQLMLPCQPWIYFGPTSKANHIDIANHVQLPRTGANVLQKRFIINRSTLAC